MERKGYKIVIKITKNIKIPPCILDLTVIECIRIIPFIRMGGVCYAQNHPHCRSNIHYNSEESRRISELKHMRKWTALMAAVLAFAALALPVLATGETAYQETDEVVYATAPVNIRTGPGTDHSILGVLRTGASIRRVAVGSNGWSKVIYSGQTAYVSSVYLSASRPAGYTDHLDDTELKRQVAIANGLNRMDYTAQSWMGVESALEKAYQAMGGNNQITADNAAEELKAAIAALIRMDYTALEKILSDVEELVESDPQNALWSKLLDAVGRGSALLTSGDQAAVDAAATEITHLYAQLEAVIEGQKAPDVVVQEIPVEVPPTDDYCNITSHRVWQVLFFLSVAVNVILIAVIVVYVSKKKRNQRDDTPLVDYDIYDD